MSKVKPLQFSFFEKCLRLLPDTKTIMLDTQYRMHAKISRFPRLKFYNGTGISESDRYDRVIKFPAAFYDYGANMPQWRLR
ncbi:unnamed protein product [Ambrosiozyma monospora]|uniref:Unnamed protein product n=2 Tax=Ambrosiozyma monospora TaxID=43982 RepID=A0ACB5TW84_AMBMO|nr:unnamed protein product [Ambrosiozyma monospora]GME96091.1 unnamed protein product [Ambrosiozyma monospora]